MQRVIDRLPSKAKTYVVMGFDLTMTVLSFYAAIALRYGELWPINKQISGPIFYSSLLIVVLIQAITFYAMGLYRGIWRYSSTPDLMRIFRAAFVSVSIAFFAVFLANRLDGVPRSAFLIDATLLVLTLGGGRFAYRIWREHAAHRVAKNHFDRVIIIGAGTAGEQLLREIRSTPSLRQLVVAFADDASDKHGKILHGVPILGSISELPSIIASTGAKKIYIAIPSASSPQIKRIVDICKDTQLQIKTLPRLGDILNGKIEFSQLRNISLEDLIGRKEISLDIDGIARMLKGRRILVTGAGGSIGSELCEQIARFQPESLILLELSEFALYTIEMQLREEHPQLTIVPLIANVRDELRINHLFSLYRPEVVFHAAAYKHVPMMEHHPIESIQTNVLGTRVIAEASIAHHVDRFVMVSTDKAVNPTNVMGATKRVAEIVCQLVQAKSPKTKFMTVRFGNVLGSSGSVIPLFKKQIERGGPLTVTHPEITRFFMSIPEAAQLIMQAGAMGNGGEIFVLDMGEAVKIVDLAKQMIELAGLRPGDDIRIEFTGLRPGEKLYEEVLMDAETTLPTPHPMLRRARARDGEERLVSSIQSLIDLPVTHPDRDVRLKLQTIVPEYTPQNI